MLASFKSHSKLHVNAKHRKQFLRFFFFHSIRLDLNTAHKESLQKLFVASLRRSQNALLISFTDYEQLGTI